MKIIFLDFDGVLNSWAWWARQPEATRDRHDYLLDPAAIGLLNQLVMRTGAHVVISSSWRLNSEMRPAATLCVCGFTGAILGQTGYLASPRGHEIAAWLDEHADVEAYVILDDDSDMAHLADRHIKTSQQVGLTQADVDRAVVMLGGAALKLQCICKTATSRAYGAEAPLGRVRDPECPIHSSCPHCLSNNIRASLETVTTAQGEVQRCWQCGGEYRDGVRVWPQAT